MGIAGVLDMRVLAATAVPDRDVPDTRLTVLLSRVAGGDLNALGPIYDACAAEMYALAHWRTGSTADAGDCVQEVFVKLASRPSAVAAVRHARRYLLAMAHRAAVDRVRARRRAVPLEDQPFLTAPAHDPAGASDASRAVSALRELPAAQREAIYLHHFAELTFREVARVTGVPTFTAASRYRLGLARLRALLGRGR
jgi:RNA polymerase sigma-70 factor (ECF subfamily)